MSNQTSTWRPLAAPLRRWWVFGWLVMLAFAFTPVSPATAQDGTPESGDTFSRSFIFYPAETGGMVAAESAETSNTVSDWIGFPDEIVTLEPGQGFERTFRVEVPDGTAPGEYIGAIAAEHADTSEIEGSSSFRQRLRFVTPIFITVPGDMTAAFSLGQPELELSDDLLLVRVPVHNDGAMHIEPKGTVTLRDESGSIIATIPVSMQAVYARESATMIFAFPGALPPGVYQLEGTFADDYTGATASIETVALGAAPAATPVPQQFRIESATVAPGPTSGNPQFVTVDATIVNVGNPATGMQLALIARRDGEEVERFPISQSLSLPTGETVITTRYIPATGFVSGQWSFELVLESVDSSGAAVVIARAEFNDTVDVPAE